MLKKTVLAAINKQIQHEQSNAHAYQAVSLYFGRLNLHGIEAFMAKQVEDERGHAAKFIAHLMDRGGQVELGAIGAPKGEFATPLEAVKHVLALEKTTTQTIHALADLSAKEGDHALGVMLNWFISEQVEEEQWAEELAALMGQFHASAGQLFMLDHQWGKRVK